MYIILHDLLGGKSMFSKFQGDTPTFVNGCPAAARKMLTDEQEREYHEICQKFSISPIVAADDDADVWRKQYDHYQQVKSINTPLRPMQMHQQPQPQQQVYFYHNYPQQNNVQPTHDVMFETDNNRDIVQAEYRFFMQFGIDAFYTETELLQHKFFGRRQVGHTRTQYPKSFFFLPNTANTWTVDTFKMHFGNIGHTLTLINHMSYVRYLTFDIDCTCRYKDLTSSSSSNSSSSNSSSNTLHISLESIEHILVSLYNIMQKSPQQQQQHLSKESLSQQSTSTSSSSTTMELLSTLSLSSSPYKLVVCEKKGNHYGRPIDPHQWCGFHIYTNYPVSLPYHEQILSNLVSDDDIRAEISPNKLEIPMHMPFPYSAKIPGFVYTPILYPNVPLNLELAIPVYPMRAQDPFYFYDCILMVKDRPKTSSALEGSMRFANNTHMYAIAPTKTRIFRCTFLIHNKLLYNIKLTFKRKGMFVLTEKYFNEYLCKPTGKALAAKIDGNESTNQKRKQPNLMERTTLKTYSHTLTKEGLRRTSCESNYNHKYGILDTSFDYFAKYKTFDTFEEIQDTNDAIQSFARMFNRIFYSKKEGTDNPSLKTFIFLAIVKNGDMVFQHYCATFYLYIRTEFATFTFQEIMVCLHHIFKGYMTPVLQRFFERATAEVFDMYEFSLDEHARKYIELIRLLRQQDNLNIQPRHNSTYRALQRIIYKSVIDAGGLKKTTSKKQRTSAATDDYLNDAIAIVNNTADDDCDTSATTAANNDDDDKESVCSLSFELDNDDVEDETFDERFENPDTRVSPLQQKVNVFFENLHFYDAHRNLVYQQYCNFMKDFGYVVRDRGSDNTFVINETLSCYDMTATRLPFSSGLMSCLPSHEKIKQVVFTAPGILWAKTDKTISTTVGLFSSITGLYSTHLPFLRFSKYWNMALWHTGKPFMHPNQNAKILSAYTISVDLFDKLITRTPKIFYHLYFLPALMEFRCTAPISSNLAGPYIETMTYLMRNYKLLEHELLELVELFPINPEFIFLLCHIIGTSSNGINNFEDYRTMTREYFTHIPDDPVCGGTEARIKSEHWRKLFAQYVEQMTYNHEMYKSEAYSHTQCLLSISYPNWAHKITKKSIIIATMLSIYLIKCEHFTAFVNAYYDNGGNTKMRFRAPHRPERLCSSYPSDGIIKYNVDTIIDVLQQNLRRCITLVFGDVFETHYHDPAYRFHRMIIDFGIKLCFFSSFLKDTMCAVLRVLGTFFVSRNYCKKLFLLVGPQNTGKTWLCQLIIQMMYPKVHTVLDISRATERTNVTATSNAVIVSEVNMLEDSLLKTVTGNDPNAGKIFYTQSLQSYESNSHVIGATNNVIQFYQYGKGRQQVRELDEATVDRIYPLYTEYTFSDYTVSHFGNLLEMMLKKKFILNVMESQKENDTIAMSFLSYVAYERYANRNKPTLDMNYEYIAMYKHKLMCRNDIVYQFLKENNMVHNEKYYIESSRLRDKIETGLAIRKSLNSNSTLTMNTILERLNLNINDYRVYGLQELEFEVDYQRMWRVIPESKSSISSEYVRQCADFHFGAETLASVCAYDLFLSRFREYYNDVTKTFDGIRFLDDPILQRHYNQNYNTINGNKKAYVSNNASDLAGDFLTLIICKFQHKSTSSQSHDIFIMDEQDDDAANEVRTYGNATSIVGENTYKSQNNFDLTLDAPLPRSGSGGGGGDGGNTNYETLFMETIAATDDDDNFDYVNDTYEELSPKVTATLLPPPKNPHAFVPSPPPTLRKHAAAGGAAVTTTQQMTQPMQPPPPPPTTTPIQHQQVPQQDDIVDDDDDFEYDDNHMFAGTPEYMRTPDYRIVSPNYIPDYHPTYNATEYYLGNVKINIRK